MENDTPPSFFEEILKKTIEAIPDKKRCELPLGIMLLENDGSLSAIRVPVNEENREDVISAMFAMDYVIHAFERQDWMSEFVMDMNTMKNEIKKRKIDYKRSNLTLIKGGLESEEG